jgi:hypothetical protein
MCNQDFVAGIANPPTKQIDNLCYHHQKQELAKGKKRKKQKSRVE